MIQTIRLRQTPALYGAGVFLLCVAAFARSLEAAPIWDDEYLTTRNGNLASWSGVRTLVTQDIWSSSALGQSSGYYRPVASLSYALNRLLLGNTATAYHAGNVLLHTGVAILLFLFITRRKIAPPSRALPMVALFATLPMVAEPVSWLAGRYDLLGSFLTMVALLANDGNHRRWTTPAVYGLALLSKEPFVVVAGLVLLDDALLLRRRFAGELIKYMLFGAALTACLTLRRLAHVPQPATLLRGEPLALVQAYVFAWWTFARLAVHPRDLCFFHTYVPPGPLACGIVLTVIVGIGLIAVVMWRHASATSRPRSGVLMGSLWCIGAMLPGALTAPTLQIIGDRYAYFPFMGAAVALTGLLTLMGRTWPVVVAWALVVVQLPRLESRLGELQSSDSMFQATLARDPDNFTTLTLWGNTLARRGVYEQAEEVLLHARRVAPMAGDIDTALCFVHLHERRLAEAEQDGMRAVAEKPANSRAWINLASVLVNEHKPHDALRAATEALRVRPRYAEAHFVRALASLELDNVDSARQDLDAVLEIDPTHVQARSLLMRLQPPGSP